MDNSNTENTNNQTLPQQPVNQNVPIPPVQPVQNITSPESPLDSNISNPQVNQDNSSIPNTQPLGNSGNTNPQHYNFKVIFILIGIMAFVMIGALFYINSKSSNQLSKPKTSNNVTNITSNPTPSPEAITPSISNTSDEQLETELQSVESDLNNIDNSLNNIDSGLNDKQTNLN